MIRAESLVEGNTLYIIGYSRIITVRIEKIPPYLNSLVLRRHDNNRCIYITINRRIDGNYDTPYTEVFETYEDAKVGLANDLKKKIKVKRNNIENAKKSIRRLKEDILSITKVLNNIPQNSFD